jgi:hypothetical protein
VPLRIEVIETERESWYYEAALAIGDSFGEFIGPMRWTPVVLVFGARRESSTRGIDQIKEKQ